MPTNPIVGVIFLFWPIPCWPFEWTLHMSQQTHSLSQRRAVPGRQKRFDTLLAEHKNRAREREREKELHQTHSQQTPPLREPHPPTHLSSAHDAHQVAHSNGPTPDANKPSPLKPRFHSPGLPRSVLCQTQATLCFLFFFFTSFFRGRCVNKEGDST